MNAHPLGMVLLCMFLLSAVAARAEPVLSLPEAIELAIQNQPLLQSLDSATAASREAAVASSQLPDPRLSLGVANLPVTGSDALGFTRDDMTMSTIGISQDVIPESKRRAASQALEAEAEQFQTEKKATAHVIRRDVALAWLDVYEAQVRANLYQRLADEFAAERKALVSNIASGAATSGEVFKLDTQLSMAVDKKLISQREEFKARAQLARWIGLASKRPLSEKLPVMQAAFQDEGRLEERISHHPLIDTAQQTEAVALSEAERAKAEYDLNWSWEVMYGRRAAFSDMLTFQVEIDLPWDRANRQDRRIAEKMLLLDRARKLTEDRRKELLAELQNVLSELETAKAREEEHVQHAMPAAKARVVVAQAKYSSGEQELSEVWDARRALIDIEMEHWIILTDQQRAAVKLGYLLNDYSLNEGIE